MKKFTLLPVAAAVSIATLMGSASVSADASDGSLTVQISDLKNQDGQVCLSLFSQSDGFPNQGDRAIASQCVKTADAAIGITFNHLSPGEYAVAMFHDANSDGTLNTGLFGIPKEGFGFSGNPALATRAPRFGEAAFTLTSQGAAIEVQLRYL